MAATMLETETPQPQVEYEPGITMQVVTIWPVYAAYLLTTSPGNRKMRRYLIKRYRRHMVNGEWMLNGQTIVLDRNGCLREGHQRLTACVESGVPFKTILVTGVDPAVVPSFDGGAARTPKDRFEFAGFDDPGNSSTAYGLLAYYLAGKAPRTGGQEFAGPFVREELAQRHPGLLASVASVRWVGTGISSPALATCHYICSLVDKEQADHFFHKLTTGLGFTEETDPIYRLSVRLRAAGEKGAAKVSPKEQMALTFSAWNAYREGRSVHRLRYDPKQAFPRAA